MIRPGIWNISLDIGGTFTDCIATDPRGALHRMKVLSNGTLKGRFLEKVSANEWKTDLRCPSPRDVFAGYSVSLLDDPSVRYLLASIHSQKSTVSFQSPINRPLNGKSFQLTAGEEVPVLACRLLTGTRLGEPLPPTALRLGSTRGTNALLEGKGARTVLLITEGFGDLMAIGTQQRDDLFALRVIKNTPLYKGVIEVRERIGSDGTVLLSLEDSELERVTDLVRRGSYESVAVAFLHSYRNPDHEQRMNKALARAGYRFISTSHALSGQIKILTRATTAVANAYLDPIIHHYLEEIRQTPGIEHLLIMTSAGGLVDSKHFRPKDSLLSGPAGGVVGAAAAAESSRFRQVITFDMGGTSTDVSLYDGHPDYRYETHVGKHRIFSPSVSIETIAAGGGSICDFNGHRFTVGPQSAGASPGPACYGAGGPLTLTDVNLLLGRLDPQLFVFPLFATHSKKALDMILKKVKDTTGRRVDGDAALLAFISIANEKMAEAIRQVSVKQGHDPRRFGLLTFGGAGGQHACSLAGMLGIGKVIVPYEAGLLSAAGISTAPIEHFAEKQILDLLDKAEVSLENHFQKLEAAVYSKFIAAGYSRNEVEVAMRSVSLRFRGQESSLEVDYSTGGLRRAFESRYRSVFGHWLEGREIEVESIRIKARTHLSRSRNSAFSLKGYRPRCSRRLRPGATSTRMSLPVYKWEHLQPGARINGPALICSENSTTFVEPGWKCRIVSQSNAILEKTSGHRDRSVAHPRQAMLELYSNRFTSIAKDMGAMLERTAFSVNVKERLDFSCALLDPAGHLVVNAPHIPVHLGSLGVCVRAVAKIIPMRKGDVIITNHPGFGGSHLPDITLIRPVFYSGTLIGYTVNRAHHAEIGGKKPGSMPADAAHLVEEGVIIPPMKLVGRGKARWNDVRRLLTAAPFPSRLPEENLADLNAGLASLMAGERALLDLVRAEGKTEVLKYMREIYLQSAKMMKEVIARLEGKVYRAKELLDDSSLLKVVITVRNGRMVFDFTGSAALHPGNFNATPAIVQSVILYVLRLLIGQPVPLNEGLVHDVRCVLPRGLLNPDFSSATGAPAVVGGNTEVSQRLTDTLLKALGLAACSQGTMNNLLFGDSTFGYYETICGGTGAGPGFDGADAVHQHMTNTRITDPEILEYRYPVRLMRFAVRMGSQGTGKWKGGNGVIREFLFNAPLEVNLLSQHRIVPPYGLKGGGSGKTGRQWLVRVNGSTVKMNGIEGVSVAAGDRLVVLTPGGGGYGRP